MYLLFATVFLLALQVQGKVEPPTCCGSEDMMIMNKTCRNQRTISLTCLKYKTRVDIDEDIDESANLHLDDNIVPPDKYCLAQHLDNHIALVCFPEQETANFTLKTVCLLSSLFIVATLVVYALLPTLRDLQGKCLMSSMTGLAITYLELFIMEFSVGSGQMACSFYGYCLYFWTLFTFFWLNIVSFNVWRTVILDRYAVSEKKLFLWYNIYGWGSPIFFLVFTLTAENLPGEHVRPNMGTNSCWFNGGQSIWLYFFGPMLVLLACNAVFFIWTAVALWKKVDAQTDRKTNAHKMRCKLYLKLFLVMGLSWLFEPLSYLTITNKFWIITDYLNALQGVLIFCILVVFRKRVRRGLAKRGLCGLKLPERWATEVDTEICESSQDNNQQLDQITVK